MKIKLYKDSAGALLAEFLDGLNSVSQNNSNVNEVRVILDGFELLSEPKEYLRIGFERTDGGEIEDYVLMNENEDGTYSQEAPYSVINGAPDIEWILTLQIVSYPVQNENYSGYLCKLNLSNSEDLKFKVNNAVKDRNGIYPKIGDITALYQAAADKINGENKNEEKINEIINSKGKPNGIATLDENGKVPITQLPESFNAGNGEGSGNGSGEKEVILVDIAQMLGMYNGGVQDVNLFLNLSKRYANGDITIIGKLDNSYGLLSGVAYSEDANGLPNQASWSIISATWVMDEENVGGFASTNMAVYGISYEGGVLIMGSSTYPLYEDVVTLRTLGEFLANISGQFDTVNERIDGVIDEVEDYVDEEIAKFDFVKVVDKLPAQGLPNREYFLRKETATDSNDLFDEYAWINRGTEEAPDWGWEFKGTKKLEVDLDDYVKNTDIASDSKLGLVKTSSIYGFKADPKTGIAYVRALNTVEDYNNAQPAYFISKAILENIKYDYVKRGIVDNNITLTDDDKEKAKKWLGISEGGGGIGEDGKSAYEIWLEQGNVGTEEDFLQSLKGAPGKDGTSVNIKASAEDCTEVGDAYIDENGHLMVLVELPNTFKDAGEIKGPKGDQGPQGEQGEQGEQGPPGKDGADGISCTHSWDGTVLEVTSASGTSSADLKGEKGDPGVVVLTQEEYDALAEKDPDTVYIIKDEVEDEEGDSGDSGNNTEKHVYVHNITITFNDANNSYMRKTVANMTIVAESDGVFDRANLLAYIEQFGFAGYPVSGFTRVNGNADNKEFTLPLIGVFVPKSNSGWGDPYQFYFAYSDCGIPVTPTVDSNLMNVENQYKSTYGVYNFNIRDIVRKVY